MTTKTKPTAVFDCEIYPDYFLAMFKDIATGRIKAFEMHPAKSLDTDALRKVMHAYTLVGFNSANFDLPLLSMALDGAKPAKIKQASDAIILNNKRVWQIEREFRFKTVNDVDHIDLIEVAPGMVSLKAYGGRMHAPKLQDLPYEPDTAINDEFAAVLRGYCANDLDITERLYKTLYKQIELRETMGKQYGLELRSKSDAQIAETVIKCEVERLTGEPVERPDIPAGTVFKYTAPWYIKFQNPVLQKVLVEVQRDAFTVTDSGKIEEPAWLKKMTVKIGNSTYRMGVGGLHSSEESTAHYADEETVLVDADATSFYPSIILTLGLHPKQMGEPFNAVYKKIYVDRVAAKHRLAELVAQKAESSEAKAELAHYQLINDSHKLFLNSSYGKFGSKYSILYSPNLLLQTTITGQLALLMLIEDIEARGIPVVSANTDGIVIKCPKSKLDRLEQAIWEWETVTQFETEETRYSAIYSRDVNNFIAIKTDMKHKAKGVYAASGLSKNPANIVCVDAAIAYLKTGKPIEETIRECADMTKFVTVRTVKGGAVDQSGKYVGKAVRWYYSTAVTGPLKYQINGHTVPRSEGAMPCMELPDSLPDDLDFEWYTREALNILVTIGARQPAQEELLL